MKEFFARLNPTERRFVVGVVVVFFLVANIVWVWPHFSDWSETKGRMDAATKRLLLFETGTNLIPDLKKRIATFQGQGEIVPSADQAVHFVRLIQNETTQFGIVPQGMSSQRQTGATNSFFIDQAETMTLDTTEKQLVDFLYALGVDTNSQIRVKVLSVQPDPSHQRLSTRVTLVASYQKSPLGGAGARTVSQGRPAADQKPAAIMTPAPAGGSIPPGAAPKPASSDIPAARSGFTNRIATNHFTNMATNRIATNRLAPNHATTVSTNRLPGMPQNLTPIKK